MRLGIAMAGLATVAVALSPPISDYSEADINDGTAFQNITNEALTNTYYDHVNAQSGSSCTWANAAVRQEW